MEFSDSYIIKKMLESKMVYEAGKKGKLSSATDAVILMLYFVRPFSNKAIVDKISTRARKNHGMSGRVSLKERSLLAMKH